MVDFGVGSAGDEQQVSATFGYVKVARLRLREHALRNRMRRGCPRGCERADKAHARLDEPGRESLRKARERVSLTAVAQPASFNDTQNGGDR